jgi:hypothetical protein
VRRELPADFRDSYPVWLCDLEIGDRTYRLSSEPVDVPDGAGGFLSYIGGMSSPTIREAIQLSAVDVPTRSASLDVVLPEAIASLRQRGYSLIDARATIALTYCKTNARRLTTATSILAHDETWLQCGGRIRSPSWGDPDLPQGALTFTVREDPWEFQSPLIAGDEFFSVDRFDGETVVGRTNQGPAPDEVIGKNLPIVLGRPGRTADPTTRTSRATGSPAYVTQRGPTGTGTTSRFLFLTQGIAEASSVTIIDSDGANETFDVETTADAFGDSYSFCSLVGATSVDRLLEQYFVIWTELGGPALRGLGEGTLNPLQAAAYLFSLSPGARIDVNAWLSVAGVFDGYQVGGYVNDQSSAWEVASENLLSLMPIAWRYSRQGLEPVIYDPSLRQGQETFYAQASGYPHDAAGGDWAADGPVDTVTEADERLRSVTVRYLQDTQTGTYRKAVTFRADPLAAFKPEAKEHIEDSDGRTLYLDQLQTRNAELVDKEIEASWVYDDATAASVAEWNSRLGALTQERAAYRLPWHWGHLRVGDVGRLSDPRREWAEAFVLVSSKEWDGAEWLVEIVKWTDPLRYSRA